MDDEDEDCERGRVKKTKVEQGGVTVAWVLETFPWLTLVL